MIYSAFQFVFLNICILYGTTHSLDDGLLDKYFEYLSNICLYSDICNATRKAEFEVSGNNVPCCHSCSCDIGCVEDRNCCLDEMYVKHKTVEEKCMSVGYSKVADSYHIVDTCQNNGTERYGDGLELYDEGSELYDDGSELYYDGLELYGNGSELYDDGLKKYMANNSCSDTIFLPVSSVKMGKVYANALCARCNGATDVKAWDVMVETREPISSDQALLFTNGHNLKSFEHTFLPPRNENWSHKKCQLTIETCSPDTRNATLQSLCTSIEAPIKVGFNTFKNAFCAVCYGIGENTLRLSRVCVSSGQGRIPTIGFTTVFNFKTLKRTSTSRTHATSSTNSACSQNEVQAHNKTECLPLLCPVGMTRIDRGNCVYIGSEWAGNYALKVLLRTTNDKPLTHAILDKLKKTSGRKLLDRINMPAPCKAFEFSGVMLYDEIVNNTEDIEQLLVVLYRHVNSEGEHPEKVIESCRSCLIDNWRFTIQTESFTFKPSLFQRKSIPDGKTRLMRLGDTSHGPPWIYTPTRFQFLHAPKDAPQQLRNDPYVYIHKLYFCNQLFLPWDEVMFGYGELVIEATGKVLYDNEFALIDDRRVAVCAEDYVVETSVVSSALRTKGVLVLHAGFFNLLIMRLVM